MFRSYCDQMKDILINNVPVSRRLRHMLLIVYHWIIEWQLNEILVLCDQLIHSLVLWVLNFSISDFFCSICIMVFPYIIFYPANSSYDIHFLSSHLNFLKYWVLSRLMLSRYASILDSLYASRCPYGLGGLNTIFSLAVPDVVLIASQMLLQ